MVKKDITVSANKVNNSVIVNANGYGFMINILKQRTFYKILKKINKRETAIIIPVSQFSLDKDEITFNGSVGYKLDLPIKMKRYCFLKKKTKWNFLKIKYHGKGFKLKKFRKLRKLSFRFGKSHWTKVIYKREKIIIRKLRTTLFCLLKIGEINTFLLNNILKKIKGINKYTKKGVRLSRSKIKRRFGKISQASSIYK